jgi:hypothetical protein
VFLDYVLFANLAHEFVNGRDDKTEGDDAADGEGEDDTARDVRDGVKVAKANGEDSHVAEVEL